MSKVILFDDPITDRTQEDVDAVNRLKNIPWEEMTEEEKAEWTNGMKGALNVADLERIENNIHLLSMVLDLGLITYEGNIPHIPTLSYWQNLIDNTNAIRDAYSFYKSTPKITKGNPNFETINNIEQIILDVYNILQSNFYYESIDEIHMGEDIGLVL